MESYMVAPLLGLLGVLVGVLSAFQIDREKAKRDFVARQVGDFYSPMAGIREEIKVLSEFRQKVTVHAHAVWQGQCAINCEAAGHSAGKDLLEPEREKMKSRIEYENNQLRKRLIPAYERMVDLFREKYWLAEDETRQYFPVLIEFVEGWNRFLSGTHSSEVLQRVDVSEADLQLFYNHLQETHDRLRRQIKKGFY